MPIARSISSRPWHYIVNVGRQFGYRFLALPQAIRRTALVNQGTRSRKQDPQEWTPALRMSVKAFDSYSGMASGEDEVVVEWGDGEKARRLVLLKVEERSF